MAANTMVDQLFLYNLLRDVPDEAKKPIAAGRLKGFTDINPMWRIKKLTDIFGPCGIGWWYTIEKMWMDGLDPELRAFVQINLYYKWNGEVSQPVPGLGGASFITKEKNGAYTSDECYKMALTDALSVAAKALGLAADVYYDKDRDKYTSVEPETKPEKKQDTYNGQPQSGPLVQTQAPPPPERGLREFPKEEAPPKPELKPVKNIDGYFYCKECGGIIKTWFKNDGTAVTAEETAQMSLKYFGMQLCAKCGAKRG